MQSTRLVLWCAGWPLSTAAGEILRVAPGLAAPLPEMDSPLPLVASPGSTALACTRLQKSFSKRRPEIAFSHIEIVDVASKLYTKTHRVSSLGSQSLKEDSFCGVVRSNSIFQQRCERSHLSHTDDTSGQKTKNVSVKSLTLFTVHVCTPLVQLSQWPFQHISLSPRFIEGGKVEYFQLLLCWKLRPNPQVNSSPVHVNAWRITE